MKQSAIEIIDEVVIAGGPSKRHRSRAGLLRLPNGELFVAYRTGWDMFATSHGAVVGTWSRDGGHSWDEPLPLLAEPGWDWFGAQRLLLLPDDSLVMLAGKARWGTDQFLTFSTRSTDDGRSWQEIGPQIEVFRFATEPYGQGLVQPLPQNRLALGFQGTDQQEAKVGVGVAFSVDAGKTWSDRVVIAAAPGIDFREPDLLQLADGRWLAVIRTDQPPYEAYQSYSADGGKHWEAVAPAGFKAHCPRLLPLGKSIVCIYRDMQLERPGISYSLTCDEGASWHFGGRLYESPRAYDGWATACGYPAAVALPDGEIFCCFHTDFIDGNSTIRGLYLKAKP
jgi:hypothetical protein